MYSVYAKIVEMPHLATPFIEWDVNHRIQANSTWLTEMEEGFMGHKGTTQAEGKICNVVRD